jgi:hypothetical protein
MQSRAEMVSARRCHQYEQRYENCDSFSSGVIHGISELSLFQWLQQYTKPTKKQRRQAAFAYSFAYY